MALVPRYTTFAAADHIIDPLDRLERYDSIDFWDRLRHWRALDYFDAMVPSFFQPIFHPITSRTTTRTRTHEMVRSKSMSQLNYSTNHHEMITKDGFKVQLDVHRFKPNEIEVRIVNDVIVIEGKQLEHWDNHKTTQRSFAHRYTLPLGYDPWLVTSTVSSDGILTIQAPPPSRGLAKCIKRFVPIKFG